MKVLQTLAFTLLLLTGTEPLLAQETSPQKKIYHNYLLKWKDSINVDTKNEVFRLWKGLPEKVKGVAGFDVIDLSMSTDKFNTIVIVVFETKEAYTKFTSHPDYSRMAALGMPLLAGLKEFDYLK
jgi:hypothetical protein